MICCNDLHLRTFILVPVSHGIKSLGWEDPKSQYLEDLQANSSGAAGPPAFIMKLVCAHTPKSWRKDVSGGKKKLDTLNT